MQRIQYFDQMKGIAIILVVIGHIMQFSFGFDPSDVVKMLGVFHMPIFFYISGYFAFKGNTTLQKMSQNLLKRTTCLLVPFAVFLSLWSIFSGSNGISTFIGGGGRYWFLWVLFIISTFFTLYGYCIRNVKNEWLYVILWIFPYLLCIMMKCIISKYNIHAYVLCIDHLVTYYRYYLIGYLCRRYSKLNSFLFKNDIVYALGFILYFLQWRYTDMHNMALIFFGGMGAIVVLQRFFESHTNNNNIFLNLLSKIGRASLAIYVIHYFFIPDISNVVHQYLDVMNPFIWQFTIATVLSLPIVAASMFVGKLIERNKYLNMLFFGKY